MTDENQTLNILIQGLEQEISYRLTSLPYVEYNPTQFVIGKLGFDNIRQTGTGNIIATIQVQLEKGPATKEKNGKEVLITEACNAKQYWDNYIIPTRQNPETTMINNAMRVLEFKHDIKRIYQCHPEGTPNIERVIEELFSKLNEAHEVCQEKDEYRFPKKIRHKKYIIITNFSSFLFSDRTPLSRKILKEIEQHAAEGRFERGIPYKTEFAGRIRLE